MMHQCFDQFRTPIRHENAVLQRGMFARAFGCDEPLEVVFCGDFLQALEEVVAGMRAMERMDEIIHLLQWYFALNRMDAQTCSILYSDALSNFTRLSLDMRRKHRAYV